MLVLNISHKKVMVVEGNGPFLLLSRQHPRWSYEGSREAKSYGEHEGLLTSQYCDDVVFEFY